MEADEQGTQSSSCIPTIMTECTMAKSLATWMVMQPAWKQFKHAQLVSKTISNLQAMCIVSNFPFFVLLCKSLINVYIIGTLQ
jgi:hypothetical protein